MLFTLSVILATHGFIHVLLLIAIVLFLVRLHRRHVV